MHTTFFLALSALLPLSLATASPQTDVVIKCASGDALCCQTIGTVSDPTIVKTLNREGVPLKQATGLVGFDCSPLNIMSQCTDHRLCCDGIADNDNIHVNCGLVDTATII
ncbi:hypothetical protein CC1G_04843 [Paecilomyces variotii No. 5]|uniref:Hydrophobin n=1 Tax=Byssochlamys spectabilis (strain No. 5 / NBRC 109023) TaxID=1356009 RepID=V5FQ90_BYSSN|nr:hypothetical protein CC1G_04843 [Paecilomyces variotii No. 5]